MVVGRKSRGITAKQNGQPVAFASRTLTSAETRYAQIEKELLAIVFVCEHLNVYVFGRDHVRAHTDHKPLESIVKKNHCRIHPKRLQCMLLRLQIFNLDVEYLKGSAMLLAGTLSRSPLEVSACESGNHFENVDRKIDLPVSDECWEQFKNVAASDYVMQICVVRIGQVGHTI